MKGIIEFQIVSAMGIDFGVVESFDNSQLRKEFENHCKKIAEALERHFGKYKMKIKTSYKVV
jgi:hypothetical protein